MSSDYRQSHLRADKGRSYHSQFVDNPHRSLIWKLEKERLDTIRHCYYTDREIHHLDFACGTGRILEHFEKDAVVSVGVDLSPSMLDVARERLQRSEIIEADITRDDVLGDRKFNLITAFRFFPNAQIQLRREVMSQLVRHLDDDGCIVFNNHKNDTSLFYRLAKLLPSGGDAGMRMTEVTELVSEFGLKIKKIYHAGVFPSTEKHLLLPRFLLGPLERRLSACSVFRNLAVDLIFVCKRDQ